MKQVICVHVWSWNHELYRKKPPIWIQPNFEGFPNSYDFTSRLLCQGPPAAVHCRTEGTPVPRGNRCYSGLGSTQKNTSESKGSLPLKEAHNIP